MPGLGRSCEGPSGSLVKVLEQISGSFLALGTTFGFILALLGRLGAPFDPSWPKLEKQFRFTVRCLICGRRLKLEVEKPRKTDVKKRVASTCVSPTIVLIVGLIWESKFQCFFTIFDLKKNMVILQKLMSRFDRSISVEGSRISALTLNNETSIQNETQK